MPWGGWGPGVRKTQEIWRTSGSGHVWGGEEERSSLVLASLRDLITFVHPSQVEGKTTSRKETGDTWTLGPSWEKHWKRSDLDWGWASGWGRCGMVLLVRRPRAS